MKPKVAIIGKGNVGSAIRRGLDRTGYEVKSVGNDPPQVREIAEWGEVIILAVPYPAIDEAIRRLGDAVRGKIVIDVTNALTPDFQFALDCTRSGAEELQKQLSDAKVVKAFNTVFAEHMDTGQVNGTTLTFFVAGHDEHAKEQVMGIGKDIGFDAVNAGPLQNARWMEALGYFNIQLGYGLKMGKQIGFKLIH